MLNILRDNANLVKMMRDEAHFHLNESENKIKLSIMGNEQSTTVTLTATA